MENKNISLEFLIKEYWSAKKFQDVMKKTRNVYLNKLKKGKLCILCLDCYDLLDWFFPVNISNFYDIHYPKVYALWKTVEKNLKTNNIKVCIPPGSALEMYHLLKRKHDIALQITPFPKKMTSPREFFGEAKELIRKYSSIKNFLKMIEKKEYIDKIIELINSRNLISIDKFFDPSQINRLDYDKIVGSRINQNKGFNYWKSIPEKSKGVKIEKSEFSLLIDMINISNNIFFNELLSKEDVFFVLVTSGLYTLHGWKLSDESNKQLFSHSRTALLLTKTLNKVGDLNGLSELLEDAIRCNKRYLEDLLSYKEIRDYIIYRKKPENYTKEINLKKSTEIKREYWKNEFKDYFTLDEISYSKTSKEITLSDAVDYSRNEKIKNEEAKKVKEISKFIYDSSSFLSPGMNGLLPDNSEVKDIFSWLTED